MFPGRAYVSWMSVKPPDSAILPVMCIGLGMPMMAPRFPGMAPMMMMMPNGMGPGPQQMGGASRRVELVRCATCMSSLRTGCIRTFLS